MKIKKPSIGKAMQRQVSTQICLLVLAISLFAVYFGLKGTYSRNLNVLSSVTRVGIPTSAPTYSLVLNQTNPKFFDTVNFTVIYPKEADQRIGRQQMYQPTTAIDCYQEGVHVYNRRVIIASKKQNGDGTLTGVTGQMTLGGGPVDGLAWLSGPASCHAYTYYFTTKQLIPHVFASTEFWVADKL